MGFTFDKTRKRWVSTEDSSIVDNLFSLEQVEQAFSSHLPHFDENHERGIAFATTHAHNRCFGAAASRILVNGKVAFCSARMGSYNSSQYGYLADAKNLGQVSHDGTRVCTAVRDGKLVELHGSIRQSEEVSVELVFVVDFDVEDMNIDLQFPNMDCAPMTMTHLLGDKTNTSAMPPLLLLPLPTRSDKDTSEMRAAVLEAAAFSQLYALRCARQAVAKGRESPTTEENAQVELLVHELNMTNCRYPGVVVECVCATLEAQGVPRDRIALRHHLNFHGDNWTPPKNAAATVEPLIVHEVMDLAAYTHSHEAAVTPESLAADVRKRLLNHKLHGDPCKKTTDAGEMKTGRGIFTIAVPCTVAESRALKMRMAEQKDTIPKKTGDPSFDFEKIVGTTWYRWETYISTGPLAAIARGLHAGFAEVLRAAGIVT